MKRLLLSFFILLGAAAWTAFAQDRIVFFGMHTSGANKGFHIAHFDTTTGALEKPTFLIKADSPAYYVFRPDGKFLYTCNSSAKIDGKNVGALSAYSVDMKTPNLKFLNQRPSGGGDPSYISLDNANKHVLVANYDGGSVCVYSIADDGSLDKQTAFIQHTGKGVDPKRQTRPYAHSIKLDPTNRFALVADLGLDKLFVYRYDAAAGTLTPHEPAFVTVKPGSGARHVTFHPNGKIVYLITEMGSTIYTYSWNSDKGTLTEQQMVSTLPTDFQGKNACAEILVHPNGTFLYCTNRGQDTIGVFAIDQHDGKLTFVQHVPTQGKMPRNFCFDPSGHWLLLTNHDSNNAVVYGIDQESGRLTQTGMPVSVPAPFCPRFLPEG